MLSSGILNNYSANVRWILDEGATEQPTVEKLEQTNRDRHVHTDRQTV